MESSFGYLRCLGAGAQQEQPEHTVEEGQVREAEQRHVPSGNKSGLLQCGSAHHSCGYCTAPLASLTEEVRRHDSVLEASHHLAASRRTLGSQSRRVRSSYKPASPRRTSSCVLDMYDSRSSSGY